ncbi:dehydrogenase/reductase SDR family member 4 [Pocillopora verrucosa]|uniref:dehydrogenase/reductase SDR family member 4 n=1 Tax=Pocillopora verrucosa TaxID=203993 RepID=UPI00333FBC1D
MSRRVSVSRFSGTLRSLRMSTTAASSRSLEGKVAVVTASTEGIGFAIAKQLARDGAKVMISSRKQDKVIDAVSKLEKEQGCTVKGVVCHVGKNEHRRNLIKETLDTFGGIDILVSNAAANPTFGPILETPEESWEKIFDINVKSAFLLAKDVVPFMKKRGGGSIVFVSSIAGLQPSLQGLGAYSVSKTALLGLTKVLANECAHMGVRVNCVAPGIIKTKFSGALWQSESLTEAALAQVPLRRLGESEDIGGAVSFLSSDQASYITGETLVIAGGMHSRL